jgi:hypothetical protein
MVVTSPYTRSSLALTSSLLYRGHSPFGWRMNPRGSCWDFGLSGDEGHATQCPLDGTESAARPGAVAGGLRLLLQRVAAAHDSDCCCPRSYPRWTALAEAAKHREDRSAAYRAPLLPRDSPHRLPSGGIAAPAGCPLFLPRARQRTVRARHLRPLRHRCAEIAVSCWQNATSPQRQPLPTERLRRFQCRLTTTPGPSDAARATGPAATVPAIAREWG